MGVVQSQYDITVHRPINITNPTNILANGSCCVTNESMPCPSGCTARVVLCLRPSDYPQNERQSPTDDCSLGIATFNILETNPDFTPFRLSPRQPPLSSFPVSYIFV